MVFCFHVLQCYVCVRVRVRVCCVIFLSGLFCCGYVLYICLLVVFGVGGAVNDKDSGRRRW